MLPLFHEFPIGAVAPDFVGDAITRTRAATRTAYTSWFATGTRPFLYFTTVVIGLGTMGIDVGIPFVFANAVAWDLAAAIALGAGLAFGWGDHTYVEENLPNRPGRASSTSPAPQGSPRADGGEQHTPDDDVDD